MMLHLQVRGCHNINWVRPEHVVPQILEAVPLAVAGGLQLPIIYNSTAPRGIVAYSKLASRRRQAPIR
jgi:putative pyruvate formate lyase activating enzyme